MQGLTLDRCTFSILLTSPVSTGDYCLPLEEMLLGSQEREPVVVDSRKLLCLERLP